MQIIEFTADSLRFIEQFPARLAPGSSFIWAFLERDQWEHHQPLLQQAAQRLGGSPVLELHGQDMANAQHPSHYDYTSVYDLVIFRRLATLPECQAEDAQLARIAAYHGQGGTPQHAQAPHDLATFERIRTRAVGFLAFDRLLISVHPGSCLAARQVIDRLLADAQISVDAASARSRIPQQPADLALRMINGMVDAYLELRKGLSVELDRWQMHLLRPNGRDQVDWPALMTARSQLHLLQDLCEEQKDAMQEWLDSLREQPLSAADGAAAALTGPAPASAATLTLAQRDQLVARARDILEHIERVALHAHRLEQSAENAVQMHFSAQSQRTNEIMRTLTAITAIFLPLNLITGFFGMNFESLPLIHDHAGVWIAVALMVGISTGLIGLFLRKRYLARSRA